MYLKLVYEEAFNHWKGSETDDEMLKKIQTKYYGGKIETEYFRGSKSISERSFQEFYQSLTKERMWSRWKSIHFEDGDFRSSSYRTSVVDVRAHEDWHNKYLGADLKAGNDSFMLRQTFCYDDNRTETMDGKKCKDYTYISYQGNKKEYIDEKPYLSDARDFFSEYCGDELLRTACDILNPYIDAMAGKLSLEELYHHVQVTQISGSLKVRYDGYEVGF